MSFELYRKSSNEGLIHFLKSRPNVKEGFLDLFENAVGEAITDKDKKGCFVVNTTTELITNNESFLEILESNKKDVETVFCNYLKRGKEDGQLETIQDLKPIASLFYTLYNGIRVFAKVRPNKKQLIDSINVALSVLV